MSFPTTGQSQKDQVNFSVMGLSTTQQQTNTGSPALLTPRVSDGDNNPNNNNNNTDADLLEIPDLQQSKTFFNHYFSNDDTKVVDEGDIDLSSMIDTNSRPSSSSTTKGRTWRICNALRPCFEALNKRTCQLPLVTILILSCLLIAFSLVLTISYALDGGGNDRGNDDYCTRYPFNCRNNTIINGSIAAINIFV